jgi:Holliday junction resolvase RusA-like endonuclease
LEFQLDVAGMPTPRPRFNGKFAYMPKTYTEYQKMLVSLIHSLGVTNADYRRLHLIFHFEYPKSTPKYKRLDGVPLLNKFDADNLAKGVMDALQKAGILEDDRQIYDLRVEKYRTTEKNKIYVKLWEA